MYALLNHLEWIYIYENNNLVSDTFLQNEKQSYTATYKFDNRNNRIEMKEFFPDRTLKLITTTSNKYNLEGRLKEWDEYNAIGKLSKRKTFEYNNAGKPTETILYLEDNKLSYKTQMKYDEKGNLTESIEYSPGNFISTKKTYNPGEYDKAGNWLKKEEFVNGKLYRTHVRQIVYY